MVLNQQISVTFLGVIHLCQQNVTRTLKVFKYVYKLNLVVLIILVGLTGQPAQHGLLASSGLVDEIY